MNEIVYVGRHALMHTVQRHVHESWEFVYCTWGEGFFRFDDTSLPYSQGEIVAIPPRVPHANASEHGFRNIHINMQQPVITLKEPAVIQDDSNHFLLNAFEAVLYHFHSSQPERTALLTAYGSLISCYLSCYSQERRRSDVVREIERQIIANYTDSAYELDRFLRSLPFSYDYLRKLFQKEIGVTPHQYLQDKRLQVAAELLVSQASAKGNVAEIARMCGFREPLYFSRVFKKKYGVSPSQYGSTGHAALSVSGEEMRTIIPDE
ncbi:MAG: AraC family transcriptional regulator [Clostridia bacterium]|nr:AraC family transcriptional regulator [Clostridia bacterium]